MSPPEPIYETPWMQKWECKRDNTYFAKNEYSNLFLCGELIRKEFNIGSATRIKVALFTEQCDEAVQVKKNSKSDMYKFYMSKFSVDGIGTCFASGAYRRLLQEMTRHGTTTLYAKCYVEA